MEENGSLKDIELGTKLKQILATRARATFSHRVDFQTVGYLNVDQMKWWCEENCKGLWRCEIHHALYWQFEEEKEAMMFMLRWSSADGNQIK